MDMESGIPGIEPYPVWLNETLPDTTLQKDKQYNYGMQWKHNKGFFLHAGRLALLLNDALSQAQWRMFGGGADSVGGRFRRLTTSRVRRLNDFSRGDGNPRPGPSGIVGL